MLDTKLDPAEAQEEALIAPAKSEETVEAEKTDEELADEVVVEISVDGMCGVY